MAVEGGIDGVAEVLDAGANGLRGIQRRAPTHQGERLVGGESANGPVRVRRQASSAAGR